MRKPLVVADPVFRYNIMDKTLKDYIERAQKKIEDEKAQPMIPNPNQYNIIPEKQSEDSDEKINPYGEH
jgi:hypothetical protein